MRNVLLGSAALSCAVLAACGSTPQAASRKAPAATGPATPILLEAEAFRDLGGWALDQQFMDQMGSPYLLAHGLGRPVKDAQTMFKATPGRHRLWVRTKDWVAPWGAKGAPGRFQVRVNGAAVAAEFGTEGAQWHWQDGGLVDLAAENQISLHDLTGFEGRCDALLFAPDTAWTPPEAGPAAAPWRRALLGLPAQPEDGGQYDLVVVGGGIAGTCAAVAAAREGLQVALIQDRFVLGGNGSSEVGVRIEGLLHQKPWPAIGNLVGEFDGSRKSAVACQNPDPLAHMQGLKNEDVRRLKVVENQPGLHLLTGMRVNAVAAKGGRIQSVTAQDIKSGRRLQIGGSHFVDATGDACVGAMAGADFEITPEGHMGVSNPWAQQLGCDCKDLDEPLSKETARTPQPVAFPRCPWAVDLTETPFPGRGKHAGQWEPAGTRNLGSWFWEAGFDRDPINEVELMRDQNLRAMYGAWDALKNVDGAYPDSQLAWAAFIAGKRESRRLLGDVIVSGEDFRQAKAYPDAAFPCTWHLDLHLPDPAYKTANGADPFISRATESAQYRYKGPYWVPYRALYSRNIANLWMAGRDISVTHEALGAVRVMRTCGMMGEVVGLAAGIAKRNHLDPRGVYEKALPELREKITRGVLPPSANP